MALFNFGRQMTKKEDKNLMLFYWITWGSALAIKIPLDFIFKIKSPYIEWPFCGIMFIIIAYALIRFIPDFIVGHRELKKLKNELKSLENKIKMFGGELKKNDIVNHNIITLEEKNDLPE
jgi:hypothetical protein